MADVRRVRGPASIASPAGSSPARPISSTAAPRSRRRAPRGTHGRAGPAGSAARQAGIPTTTITRPTTRHAVAAAVPGRVGAGRPAPTILVSAGVRGLVRAGQVRVLGALGRTALARIDRSGQLVGIAGRGLDGFRVADHHDRPEARRLQLRAEGRRRRRGRWRPRPGGCASGGALDASAVTASIAAR